MRKVVPGEYDKVPELKKRAEKALKDSNKQLEISRNDSELSNVEDNKSEENLNSQGLAH